MLVEQSVNTALQAADRSFFLEQGTIRFRGLTAELFERPDLLRSVFLDTAVATDDARRRGCPRDRSSTGSRSRRSADRPLARRSCSRPIG